VASRRDRITVALPDGPFTTHLVLSDPGGDFIIVAAPADGPVDPALLALPRVTLVAEPEHWHIEFVSAEPREVVHEGVAAIRLRFPEILSVQQRRQSERYDAPAVPALRCVADAGGFAPFDAQIRDISLGGISALIYPPDVIIEPGTVLAGSRIDLPGADPVTVDLEVRYSEILTLDDGSSARCSGFRFLNVPDEVKQRLIEAIDRL
jgi:c-di-GMP-binding flagellar brake protein YcgR